MRLIRSTLLSLLVLGAACGTDFHPVDDEDQLDPLRPAGKATVTAQVAPAKAVAGDEVLVTLTASWDKAIVADLVLFITAPDGSEAYTASWTSQAFSAGGARTFTESLQVEQGDALGAYAIGARLFRTGNPKQLFENAALATLTIQAATTPSTPPAPGLPPGWSSQDIGNPTPAGSASATSGTFSVEGAGADIWGTSDSFRFAFHPLNGDGILTARVLSQGNTNGWAKAGLMLRDGLAADARHASIFITPSNGASFQRRINPGGSSVHTAGPPAKAPSFVRLARQGNTVTSFVSGDGSTWTQVGSETLALPAQVQVGLAVTSHADGTLSAATFDQVAFSQAQVTTAPAVPVGLVATAGDRQVALSWQASAAAARYRIFIGGTASPQEPTAPQATLSGLTNGVSYSFTVAAIDQAGNVSAQSVAASATPIAPAQTWTYDVLVHASDSNAQAQAKINTAGPGKVIGYEPGVHRLRTVRPLANQTHRGHPTQLTTFLGAQPVTGWVQDGTRWRAGVGFSSNTNRHIDINRGWRGDQYREEVFYLGAKPAGSYQASNGRRLRRVESLAEVTAGRWWFDDANQRIFVGDNPGGLQVLISRQPVAFEGNKVLGVAIEDLRIEKYATQTRESPVQEMLTSGAHKRYGWTFRRLSVVDSHGASFAMAPGDRLFNCQGLYAGQLGLAGKNGGVEGGAPVLPFEVHDTEIGWSLQVGYNWGWEGGGSKLSGTLAKGNLVRNSWFHHNAGPGIWFDVATSSAHEEGSVLVESTLSEHNEHAGIFYEIMRTPAVFRWNTVRYNGVGSVQPELAGPKVYGDYGRGIDHSNSWNTTYQENLVYGNRWHALWRDDDRGMGIKNNRCIRNHFGPDQMNSAVHVVKVKAGVTQQQFDLLGTNLWEGNKYYTGTFSFRYGWNGSLASGGFAQWQGLRPGSFPGPALDSGGQLLPKQEVPPDPPNFQPFVKAQYGPAGK